MLQMEHRHGRGPAWTTQTAGARRDDVISRLTAEQALKIVERLTRNGGKIREAVLTEAMNILNGDRLG